MAGRNERDFRLKKLMPCVPVVLVYQVATKLVLVAVVLGLRLLANWLMALAGRPAFTSGDLPYLLSSWQGIALVIVGLLVLFVYVAFDVNALILLANKIVHGAKISIPKLIKEAVLSMRIFFQLHGVLIVLYIAFITPLVGGVFGISLTAEFAIPDFILSVITGNTALRFLYYALLLVLAEVGLIYVYTIHFALLDGLKSRAALKAAKSWMIRHWRQFICDYGVFIICSIAALAVLILALFVGPTILIEQLNLETTATRFWLILIIVISFIVIGGCLLLFVPLQIVKLTYIFVKSRDHTLKLTTPKRRHRPIFTSCCIVVASLGCVVFSVLAAENFDILFPARVQTQIIAHRGAGKLSSENTAQAIQVAADNDVYASEIDIQRTRDGHYILNHDDDFWRVAGDEREPQDLTLAEIKSLRLSGGATVSTLEEALSAAQNRVHLYVELKGATADTQMVDDTHRIIAEHDMLEQVTLISLRYDLIDYTATNYPDVATGYLAFFGFGEVGELNTDSLALESELATKGNIKRIQALGKRVDVWTCNTPDSIIKNMASGANGIITDEVKLAQKIERLMQNRSDLMRILSVLMI